MSRREAWRDRVVRRLARRDGPRRDAGAPAPAEGEQPPDLGGPGAKQAGAAGREQGRDRSRKPGRRRRRQRGGPLADLDSLVPAGPGRSVLILAHPTQRQQLLPWLKEFSGDRVCVIASDEAPEWELEGTSVVLHIAANLSKVNARVRMLPALDVVVDLLPVELLPTGAEDHLDLFATVFRYIKQHGAYVFDRRVEAPGPTTLEPLTRWLELLTATEDRARLDGLRWREVELARATGAVVVSRDLVLATKRTRHYVKLLDSQVERTLAAREPTLQVTDLETRSGGTFESRATVVSHSPGFLDERMPSLITYPPLHLRHYEGRVALAGRSLLHTGHTVLPDSFRWHLQENPSNPGLTSVSRHFARIPSAYVPRRALEGSFYQLDSAYPHHFGHLTTEVVSRLWGWDTAKREIPGLRVIFHLKSQSRRDPTLEKALFCAYGIDESDIVWVNEPVWLESVVSATPMWHNAVPHYVHPDMVETWQRLRRGLTADESVGVTPERIFVSRGRGAKHRTCRNTSAVEEFFATRGYTVIYPEELSLAQQVATFRDARVVAGFGGSAMFNLMYAQKVEAVVVLNQEAYSARNEHLFTSLTGGAVHYFWSTPDVDPEGGLRPAAFTSDWEFDFERNGAELDQVLAQLG